VSAPTVDPEMRSPAQIAPTNSYRPRDRVWVYRNHGWRSGVIEAVSERAAMVTYRPTQHRGTGVDTVTARYVIARAEEDPLLDRPPLRRPA
jgi:hypothetical protein